MAQAARSRTLPSQTDVTESRKCGSAAKAGPTKAAKPTRVLAAKKAPASRAAKRPAAVTKKAAASPSPAAKRAAAVAKKAPASPAAKRPAAVTKKAAAPAQTAAPAVERRQGSGLGAVVSVEAGRARLDAYVTPRSLESWAGPVAGAGDIQRSLGVPRQTLSNWRQAKAAIGLLKGQRNLAYPLDQFVDGRPVEGLARVVQLAPSERAAWLWLRQPHAALGGRSPLDLLKQRQAEPVAQAAERDFL